MTLNAQLERRPLPTIQTTRTSGTTTAGDDGRRRRDPFAPGSRLFPVSKLGQIGDDIAVALARENFAAYRIVINGEGFKWGWWTQEVADELQQFYDDLVAGKAPILALMAPPQHGTELIEYPTYNKTIIEADGRTHNKQLGGGYLMCTTVDGQINGFGLHLGVIDDPVKNRKEAYSETKRLSTWNWFLNDVYSRFDERAGLLIIMTRWHTDDLPGAERQWHAGWAEMARARPESSDTRPGAPLMTPVNIRPAHNPGTEPRRSKRAVAGRW